MRNKVVHTVLMAVVILLISSCKSSSVSAFTIVSPAPGSIYHPGDRVTVRTEAARDESIIAVWFAVTGMHQGGGSILPPYEFTFTIPRDYTGSDTILAIARTANNTTIQAKVQIQVVLPANITLQGISVDPTFILLQIMPTGSDPNDIRIAENQNIGVGGTYSDGIERGLTSPAKGTTYVSSDEKVVTVDAEGNISAQGLGKATIIVRNGKFRATVKVVVQAFKK